MWATSGVMLRMQNEPISFTDGSAYERYMGRWSRLAGDIFLDWLAPDPGWRWLDVGCGNGAFTERLLERCEPASVHGVDPSAEQLAHARAQACLKAVRFVEADAMALPYPDDAFDAAVMPLVIFFVPDPGRGVAEMRRVVRAGGLVAAYAWDMTGGGFPYELLHAEMRALGIAVPMPPSPEASRLSALRDLWTQAGLQAVETHEISVSRRFADFEDFWETARGAPSAGSLLTAMPAAQRAALRDRIRALLPVQGSGEIICSARANAVKGRVSG